MDITTLALLLLGPILIWRVYSRVKAQMTRQRSIMQRHYTGLGVFAVMIVVPASQLVDQPALLTWLAVGAIGGIAYGVWGLKLTRFESTNEGYFFTPNPRLGLVIAMLFVACLMYIGFEIFANKGSGLPTPKVTDYPFSLPSLGLMAGYFATYSAGLLAWRRKMRKEIDAR